MSRTNAGRFAPSVSKRDGIPEASRRRPLVTPSRLASDDASASTSAVATAGPFFSGGEVERGDERNDLPVCSYDARSDRSGGRVARGARREQAGALLTVALLDASRGKRVSFSFSVASLGFSTARFCVSSRRFRRPRRAFLCRSHAHRSAFSCLRVSNSSRYLTFRSGSDVGKHRSNSPARDSSPSASRIVRGRASNAYGEKSRS